MLRNGLRLAGAAVALSLAAPAFAQVDARPPRPSVIVNPEWARKPTPDEIMNHYPTDALRQDLSGRVLIRCDVALSGVLENCAVVEETPAGVGFGAAALAMTPLMLMKPMTKNGVPVEGGKAVVPISFAIQPREKREGFLGKLLGK